MRPRAGRAGRHAAGQNLPRHAQRFELLCQRFCQPSRPAPPRPPSPYIKHHSRIPRRKSCAPSRRRTVEFSLLILTDPHTLLVHSSTLLLTAPCSLGQDPPETNTPRPLAAGFRPRSLS